MNLSKLFWMGCKFPLMLSFGVIVLMVSACNNHKYLNYGEHLVVKNNINIKEPKKYKSLNYGLSVQIRQKPNERFFKLFRTRLWIYNKFYKKPDLTSRGQVSSDSIKPPKEKGFRHFMTSKIGEAPVLYDSLKTKRTAESMHNYLVNRGYYRATVSFKTKFKKHKAIVDYSIIPNEQLLIDSIAVDSRDTFVLKIVRAGMKKSGLKKGNPLDADILNYERARITQQLKTLGYYYFSNNYIEYEIDTFNQKKADVYLNILMVNDTLKHHFYRMDSVMVHLSNVFENVATDTLVQDGISFIYKKGDHFIKPKALRFLIENNLKRPYNYLTDRKTYKNIRDLGLFRSVSIDYTLAKEHIDALVMHIKLLRNKKMTIGGSFEGNVFGNNMGIALGANFKHNNLFKGAESFIVKAEGGLEFNYNKNQRVGNKIVNTIDVNTETSLYLPRYVGIKKIAYWLGMKNPRTRISFKYSKLYRLDAYKIDNYNAAFGYEWSRLEGKSSFSYNLFNTSLLVPVLDPYYSRNTVKKNQILLNSFKPYVIMTMLGGLNWTYNGIEEGKKSWIVLRTRFESSGNVFNVIDRIYKPNDTLKLFAGSKNLVDYSQFVLGDVDLRYTKLLSRKVSWVSRLFTGVGLPYFNSRSMPYIRQYYVGGTNSIRAWPARQLGPGSYIHPSTDSTILDLTGDIRLEMNTELRFPLFSYLEGALFIDVGNVWTMRADENRRIDGYREGTEFHFNNFYKQLAVGAGVGFRFNFSYFILRFDFATQLRYPYPFLYGGQTAPSYWRKGISLSSTLHAISDTTFNLGVGYPF